MRLTRTSFIDPNAEPLSRPSYEIIHDRRISSLSLANLLVALTTHTLPADLLFDVGDLVTVHHANNMEAFMIQFLLIVVLTLSGCHSSSSGSAGIKNQDLITQIKIGKSTKNDATLLFGKPTSVTQSSFQVANQSDPKQMVTVVESWGYSIHIHRRMAGVTSHLQACGLVAQIMRRHMPNLALMAPVSCSRLPQRNKMDEREHLVTSDNRVLVCQKEAQLDSGPPPEARPSPFSHSHIHPGSPNENSTD